MRRIVVLIALGACANGTHIESDSGTPPDSSTNDALILPLDASKDVALADAGVDAFDAGCVDAALGGIGMPAGSTATATSSYDVNTPDLTIDGDITTYWNSGGTTGSLTITFPAAQTFDAVRISVTALPTCDETYTITGFQDANPVLIGSSTQSAVEGGSILQPIAVTAGTYEAIRIDVSSTQSWVAISEVALVTPYCP